MLVTFLVLSAYRVFEAVFAKEMVGAPTASSSLKEYLKRYQDGNEEENKKKKKKKVKGTTSAGVLVVDGDPIWQKPVTMGEEEDNESAGKLANSGV